MGTATTKKDTADATAYVRVQTPRASTAAEVAKANALLEAKIGDLPCPLDSASWLSRVTLWWVGPLIRNGYASPLTEDDVWKLPKIDGAIMLQESFDRYFAQEKHKRAQANKTDASTPIHMPMWHATKNKMGLAILLHVLSAACSMVQPLLIKSLLQYLQGKDNFFGITSGYTLALILVASTFASVSMLDYGMYLTMRAGLNARMIAVNSVYQKILKLTTSARQAMNSGDIITLAGADSERLAAAYGLGVWTVLSPVMVTVVCILIGVEMGWYVGLAAAGCGASILLYAMNNSRKIGLCRRQILAIAGERVKVTNEVLQGIRVIKMYAWEDSITERVREIREREIAVIRRYSYLRANNTVVLSMAQAFMVVLCFIVYIYTGNDIDVPTAFTLLAFAGVCRQPFGIFSNAVVFVSEAIASMQRISKFLASDEIDANPNQDMSFHDDTSVIEIRDGDFSWGKTAPAAAATATDDKFADTTPDSDDAQHSLILSNINLAIPSGSLTIVVGAVGSGKSSLMNALLGEMHQSRGACLVKGNVAYASQQAWIQHSTVRENILFGTAFDQTYYDQVIAACQLERDLEILKNGDATEIGERGINLSGGQKARVSLARVMYRRNADIMILDDPLSALDVHVANSVFFQCVLGLVREKTRVLVLNSHYHLLRHADRIIVLADGKVVGDGSYEDVKSTFTYLEDQSHSKVAASGDGATDDSSSDSEQQADANVELLGDDETESDLLTDGTCEDERESIAYSETPETMERLSLSRVSNATSTVSRRVKSVVAGKSESAKKKKTQVKESMMLKEDRQIGKLGWRVYAEFFATSGYNGVVLGVVVFAAFALGQGALLGSDYFLTYWSNGSMSSTFDQTTLLWLYAGTVVLATLLSGLRAVVFTEICIRCSKGLHAVFFRMVAHAPVTTFFDITPVGQILNRFSRDLDQIDNPLPYFAMMFLQAVMSTIAVFIVCAVTTPYTIILYVPLFVACYYIQTYFQATARELKRLDGVTRSPFLNLVAETINGIESIRSFQMADTFSVRCSELLDHNGKFFFMYQSASKWFALRLDWLVSSVVCVVSFLCVASRDSIGPANAGIALTYAIQLTMQFQRLMTLGTMTENFMTSFERISHYKNLETEGATKAITTTPDASWPRQGTIAFENVSLRYRDGLELVLKNVSFAIQDGEKIGVCGRTGSGKSTLMSALFRVVECAAGRITIDGVDIATVKIQDLRSKLTIIPQDPVLFSGPLRLNLDPFNEKPDDEVWAVLRKVHLFDDVSKWGQGLEYEVAEKGDNLSVGQRQLVCIARALLRQSRIIVLDEATANVDQELDRLIQVAVKENFQDKTAMTIAHRLETIADSDRILVLDHGEVMEFDAPATLLAKPDGIFASLIHSTKK